VPSADRRRRLDGRGQRRAAGRCPAPDAPGTGFPPGGRDAPVRPRASAAGRPAAL